MFGIVSAVAGLATTWLTSRAEERRAKAVATTEALKAEAEARHAAAKDTATWERLQARGATDSWKDEAWTLCFIAILVSCFIPGAQPYLEHGFTALNAAPDWFQWALLASIAASFGLRGMHTLIKK